MAWHFKKSGVSPKELDDTSIGPYLSIQAPNKNNKS